MRTLPDQYKDRCAFITTFYESPFERVMHWCWQDKHPDTRFWDLVASPFDTADTLWRRWYARHPRRAPSRRWARSGPDRTVYVAVLLGGRRDDPGRPGAPGEG